MGACYSPIDEAQKTPRPCHQAGPGGGEWQHTRWQWTAEAETVTSAIMGSLWEYWGTRHGRERGTVNDHYRQYMELRRPQRGIGVEDEAKTKLIYWRGGDRMAAWPRARVVILTSYCLCGKWIEYNWNGHDGVGWGQGVNTISSNSSLLYSERERVIKWVVLLLFDIRLAIYFYWLKSQLSCCHITRIQTFKAYQNVFSATGCRIHFVHWNVTKEAKAPLLLANS